MSGKTLDEHIEVTPDTAGGRPRIRGRRITAQEIALWHEWLRKSADEIAAQYDLTLADVYAALAYYFDHREEIDARMTRTAPSPRRFARARRPYGTRSFARCVARLRFLTDEHIPNAVAYGLRARGIAASTAGEAGQLGASDAALLAFARTEGRVLITADPDHLRLHASGVPHTGILFAASDVSIGVISAGALFDWCSEIPGRLEKLETNWLLPSIRPRERAIPASNRPRLRAR